MGGRTGDRGGDDRAPTIDGLIPQRFPQDSTVINSSLIIGFPFVNEHQKLLARFSACRRLACSCAGFSNERRRACVEASQTTHFIQDKALVIPYLLFVFRY